MDLNDTDNRTNGAMGYQQRCFFSNASEWLSAVLYIVACIGVKGEICKITNQSK